MSSKQWGSLGIGSFYSLNAGLLFKWLWRFLIQSTDLWVIVIKEIHGYHGGVFDLPLYISCFSP
jgi:hypothetical protein